LRARERKGQKNECQKPQKPREKPLRGQSPPARAFDHLQAGKFDHGLFADLSRHVQIEQNQRGDHKQKIKWV